MPNVRTDDLVRIDPYEENRTYTGRVVALAYDDPVLTGRGQVVKPVWSALVDLGDRTIVALVDELSPVQAQLPAVTG